MADSSFDLSKFDPSTLDLSHLHRYERDRILRRGFHPNEVALLLDRKNPWTKSGKPEPLPSPQSQESTQGDRSDVEWPPRGTPAQTRAEILYDPNKPQREATTRAHSSAQPLPRETQADSKEETRKQLEALHSLIGPPPEPEPPKSRVPEEPKPLHETIQNLADEALIHIGRELEGVVATRPSGLFQQPAKPPSRAKLETLADEPTQTEAEILAEHKKSQSTLRAICAFLRRFVAIGGAFLLGASWTMIQIDEYALALILLVIGMGAFSVQIYDWKGIENHRRATRVLKGVAVVLIVCSLAFFAAVIVKKKGTKPLSNLLAKETRPEIAKQPFPSPFPSPSVATSPLLARATPSPITTPSRSSQSLPPTRTSTPPIAENNITDFRVIRDVGRSVAVEAWYVYSGTAGTENILVTAQVLQADGGGVSVSATDSPVIAVNTKAYVEIWFNYQPIREGDTVASTSIELCMIQQTKGAFYCRKFPFKKVWK